MKRFKCLFLLVLEKNKKICKNYTPLVGNKKQNAKAKKKNI